VILSVPSPSENPTGVISSPLAYFRKFPQDVSSTEVRRRCLVKWSLLLVQTPPPPPPQSLPVIPCAMAVMSFSPRFEEGVLDVFLASPHAGAVRGFFDVGGLTRSPLTWQRWGPEF